MRQLIVLLFVIATTTFMSPRTVLADTPKPANLAETLDLMLDHLRPDFPDAKINVAEQNIILDADGQMVLNPDNLHAILQTTDDGTERETQLVSFLDTVKASLDQPPVTDGIPLDRVYPVLRHKSFAQASGDASNGAAPYAQPFLGDMILVYAIDYPDHVAYVTQSHLDDAQVTLTQLRQAADLNLSQKLDETQFQQQNGSFMVITDGFYESSMVLDSALWANLSRQLDDDLVMIVPARDLVVFAPASNADAVNFLETARDNILSNGTHQLSDFMYLWQDGAWQFFAR
ncbi:DUF1444 family protein [Octadecabacter sp.]|nr:DUF1444 family protein [Octadecabacter sp.]